MGSSKHGSTVRFERVSQWVLETVLTMGIVSAESFGCQATWVGRCLLFFKRPSGQRTWSSVTAMILPVASLKPMACWKR